MPKPTTQPSFGHAPQDHPAAQGASGPKSGRTTAALAERHEALWLSLVALHKDIVALGARKPGAPISEPVRITAESLLSDCVPFLRRPKDKLPVAAGDMAGLAVQLGQALAALEFYEIAHSSWDGSKKCLAWRLGSGATPVRRLRPQVDAGEAPGQTREMARLQDQLARRINAITKGLPDEDEPPRARSYAPRPPAPQTYPPCSAHPLEWGHCCAETACTANGAATVGGAGGRAPVRASGSAGAMPGPESAGQKSRRPEATIASLNKTQRRMPPRGPSTLPSWHALLPCLRRRPRRPAPGRAD